MSDCSVETVQSRVTVLGVGDTLPIPRIALLDSKNEPVDATGITVAMTFTDVEPSSETYTPVEEFTVNGVQEASSSEFTFTLPAGRTDQAAIFRTKVEITEGGGTYTRPTAAMAVVDFDDLWASPLEVARHSPGHTHADYVVAILSAEAAVRAWVSTPISSPVSERVAYAITLLASRALSTSPAGTSIVSETMGDYTVRFARSGPGGLFITEDIAELLAPWRPRQHSLYVGPDNSTTYLETMEVV